METLFGAENFGFSYIPERECFATLTQHIHNQKIMVYWIRSREFLIHRHFKQKKKLTRNEAQQTKIQADLITQTNGSARPSMFALHFGKFLCWYRPDNDVKWLICCTFCCCYSHPRKLIENLRTIIANSLAILQYHVSLTNIDLLTSPALQKIFWDLWNIHLFSSQNLFELSLPVILFNNRMIVFICFVFGFFRFGVLFCAVPKRPTVV